MASDNINILASLTPGEEGIITKVKGYGAFRKRITEMGFVPGTAVKVIKKAPLGDPMELELMGYRISLRKNEATLIEIVSKGSTRIWSSRSTVELSLLTKPLWSACTRR